MSSKSKPATLRGLAVGQCPACGARDGLVHFTAESFTVNVGDLNEVVHGLTGNRCSFCDDAFFDDASSARYSDSGDSLVQKVRKAEGAKLRKARLALGLSQAEAGLLAGGGHNGFSRYENGLAIPVPAVSHLFQLLQSHPQLLAELPGVTVRPLPKAAAASARKQGCVRINGKPVEIVVCDVSRAHKEVISSRSARKNPSRPSARG